MPKRDEVRRLDSPNPNYTLFETKVNGEWIKTAVFDSGARLSYKKDIDSRFYQISETPHTIGEGWCFSPKALREAASFLNDLADELEK